MEALQDLKILYTKGELNKIKEGVLFKYSTIEKSYYVKGESFAYSLKTNDLEVALKKFYKKEILSSREAKRIFDFAVSNNHSTF